VVVSTSNKLQTIDQALDELVIDGEKITANIGGLHPLPKC
jgi:hypothetical protein